MREPIGKSKRQLAQLLIEAGVTKFPEGANWAAQDKDDKTAWFHKCKDVPNRVVGCDYWDGYKVEPVQLPTLIPNWHQTVLSRDEFDQIVAETAVQSEPVWSGVDMSKDGDDTATMTVEPTTAPTLDQLLQDWRNADDYAQRKQTEADEAAAMRDERWQAVQARAGEMGVTVGRCESVVESEPEREWEIHDRCVVVDAPDDRSWEGLECTLIDIDRDDETLTYCVRDDLDRDWWVRSIRRP